MSEGFRVISVNPEFPRVEAEKEGISHQDLKLIIIKKVNPIKITNDAKVKDLTCDEHEMENQLKFIKIC